MVEVNGLQRNHLGLRRLKDKDDNIHVVQLRNMRFLFLIQAQIQPGIHGKAPEILNSRQLFVPLSEGTDHSGNTSYQAGVLGRVRDIQLSLT